MQDDNYVGISQRLRKETADTLVSKVMFWHRQCYADATNRQKIERVECHFIFSQKRIFVSKRKGRRSPKGDPSTSGDQDDFTIRFRRSNTLQFYSTP